MTHAFPFAALMAATLAGAAGAQTAPADPAGTAPALSTIIGDLEERGYDVADIDVGGRVIEVEAMSPQGLLVDLRIEAATGTVLSEMPED
ncbi:PepSY domain-containing protein [Rubellimicrobium rubrum]|nr:PepSY domain-containing protein [Rubellimicrobium rubrum]